MTDIQHIPSLDPDNWDNFRARAHQMLESAIDQMAHAGEGRVWTEPPDDLKTLPPIPVQGDAAQTDTQMKALLPYGVGNTHPRFFGWVHGSGTPSNIIADMVAGAMNANLGGRDHGAIYIEKQVVSWCKAMFGFPETASGLVVSGTSIATLIALKSARDRMNNFATRASGVQPGLVGYTSTQTHSCVARTFDMLGLGSDALRKIPVNDAFEMDTVALQAAIDADRAAGLTPFAIIGTAGAVNVGAIDDLDTLADIAATENLWFHVDGAFGATAILSDKIKPRLTGLTRADSIAFDFHKWLHVNYDAGFILIRDEDAHRRAFSERPDYLAAADRGLAAGNPWPTEYGPELSRGFRALKIWAQLSEHGTDKLGQLITQNCNQAQYLADKVNADPAFELCAPVALNICCFRFTAPDVDLSRLNAEIVIQLQLDGVAAPSTTVLNGNTVIRVNITNHRTAYSDLDILLKATHSIGTKLVLERSFATT
ncbi:cytochrome D ubiquinol oxidase subunit I [Loktanella sp. D2R18]|uniref:pyridoxal phosphate-dependent decarboxylase family protein n=1 Tax=Rhodobacterales TaxID=204455 RepID=UPI000DEAB4DA|nr:MULTISPECIES: pyridoxal-dependent decarboxylase [Rhodobacterales]MDO6592086.1 pyridoxal-dependent decarboxylase [Yoonia sp. 1_MG-2023]RBW43118.1 cytochrome D ubiquinol oxidase subunit I [Loktanella sp. D2R18]